MTSLALCCVMRDEDRYIAEWISFHILQGVSKFLIYDNGSNDRSKEFALKFSEVVDVELINWPLAEGHFDAHQRAAYKDAALRLRGRYDFVAFIDVDEFLFDKSDLSLPDCLSQFTSDVSAIAVEQNAFGSSGLLAYSAEPVIQRFTRCGLDDNLERYWFKTVVRPERVGSVNSCHSVLLDSGSYVLSDGLQFDTDRPGRATRLTAGSLTLNHYIVKSLEEYRFKQAKWSDRTEFQARYNDGYFFYRTELLNEVTDLTAANKVQGVLALIQKCLGA